MKVHLKVGFFAGEHGRFRKSKSARDLRDIPDHLKSLLPKSARIIEDVKELPPELEVDPIKDRLGMDDLRTNLDAEDVRRDEAEARDDENKERNKLLAALENKAKASNKRGGK